MTVSEAKTLTKLSIVLLDKSHEEHEEAEHIKFGIDGSSEDKFKELRAAICLKASMIYIGISEAISDIVNKECYDEKISKN